VSFDPGTGAYSASYREDDGGMKSWTYKPFTYPHPLRTSGPLADIFLTITSPNGTEVWRKGELRQISWTAQGITEPLTIEILQGETVSGLVATGINADTGAFFWTVGRLQNGSFISGENLKIRIRSSDDAVSASMDI